MLSLICPPPAFLTTMRQSNHGSFIVFLSDVYDVLEGVLSQVTGVNDLDEASGVFVTK